MIVPPRGFQVNSYRGQKDVYTIDFKKVNFKLNDQIFIAVQTEYTKFSEMSNIVNTRFVDGISGINSSRWKLILSISVGAFLIVVLTSVFAIIIIKKKKRSNYKKNILNSSNSNLEGKK